MRCISLQTTICISGEITIKYLDDGLVVVDSCLFWVSVVGNIDAPSIVHMHSVGEKK